MDTMIKKDQLLLTLKANRSEHREIFEEALEGYKKTVIAELERQLSFAREGKRVTRLIKFTEPVDQTREYDRAIKMLEMDTRFEITLNDVDFRCYVMDDWGWKQEFLVSNSNYSGKAADTLGKY